MPDTNNHKKMIKEMGEMQASLDWLKKELDEIKSMMKDNQEEIKEMIRMNHKETRDMIKELEKRVDNLENRTEALENFKSMVKGGAVVLSILAGSTLVVWILSKVLG